jgi:tetratricopeptide (TPR) repeat protein
MNKANPADGVIALFNEGRFEQALARVADAPPDAVLGVEVLNIAAACACALARPAQAEQYWRLALRRDPAHAPTWNNLGILLQQGGRGAEAEAAYHEALALQPDFADAHYNLGLLLQQSGALDAAHACYQRALALRPGHADTYNNLGALYRMREQWPAALACFRQAAALQPENAQAQNNLGLALAHVGRMDEAEAALGRALALQPGFAAARANLDLVRQAPGRGAQARHQSGNAAATDPDDALALHQCADLLQTSGHWARAEACYLDALERAPERAGLHNNLAVLQSRMGRLDAAEASYRRALALRPDYAEALHNLAMLYMRQRRHAQAEWALRDFLALRPDDPDGLNSLGNLHQQMHRYADAEQCYRRALARRPSDPKSLNNLAVLLQHEGRAEEAEAAYRATIDADPGYPEARWNLGFMLLARGRLAEGWPLMEARYDPALAHPIAARPVLGFPQWRDESLAGRSIVVWPEQGFGDQIQFVRYLPMLKAAGASRVTLVCQDPLVPLLRDAAGADAVLALSAAATRLPPHDYWVFMLSLPMHFRTTPATIPAALPYLAPDPARIRRWRPRLGADGVRVGLVWRGFGGHVNDANRSLPDLACLAPLWRVPGVAFVSLQRGMDGEGAGAATPDLPLLDLGPEIADFADTAAIVSLLDLVVCVDTAVAHVAGALGKPCWVLLPAVHPDWRWMEARADSPWYPGVLKLYRQTAPGDWRDVVDAVAADLAAWTSRP